MPKVLITRKIPRVGISILQQYSELEIDYRQGKPLSGPKLKEAVKGLDAIITVAPDKISKEVIDAAGKTLKLIATYSVGYDHIDIEHATKKGVHVSNTPGSLTESVAEYCMSLMFALTRHIPAADRYCRNGKYKYWDPMLYRGRRLMGKTLGIIGFGRIGQYFARLAKYGLNMDILYFDIVSHTEAESILDAKKVELDYLLSNSDVVSINTNLTDETRHMISEQEFKKMKPLAYLVNTARGPIVNEEALVVALKEGIIAGAALDVFENEPKINPKLLKMDNVILTPHIASATRGSRIQMARMVAENVVDVLISSLPPRYAVNSPIMKETVQSII